MRDFTKYKDCVYEVIGAAMDVYNELGFGLRETVYQEALALELNSRGILCEREKEVHIYYKGEALKQFYKMDMLVENDIIVETKGVVELCAEHRAQLFNYMRLTQKPIGLLINFGDYDNLYGERYVLDDNNLCFRVDKNMMPLQ
ncbi:MAG: GxxExxY protein [Bacteroidaceae bacterium]|nr:GxxExxY protein [Bacteroidaceae bacterium]